MSESNQTGGGEPFDFEEFARQTIGALEDGDWAADATEHRLIRLEEIIAARWPRWWLLRRRLARELRASVAGYGPELYARGDFRGRRVQAVGEQLHFEARERRRAWDERRQQAAEDGQPGTPDPGAGFLS